MTGSMIIDVAYGIKAQPEDDEFIGIADRALRGIEKCTNMNIIDILPWGTYLESSSVYFLLIPICSISS